MDGSTADMEDVPMGPPSLMDMWCRTEDDEAEPETSFANNNADKPLLAATLKEGAAARPENPPSPETLIIAPVVKEKRRGLFGRPRKEKENNEPKKQKKSTKEKKTRKSPLSDKQPLLEPTSTSTTPVKETIKDAETVKAVERPAKPDFECDFDKNPTILFQALHKRDWDFAVQHVKDDPVEATIWVKRFEPGGTKIRWRLLPLHAAVVFGAPLKVIDALLEANPQGAYEMDDENLLPVHLAHRVGSPEAVKLRLTPRPNESLLVDTTRDSSVNKSLDASAPISNASQGARNELCLPQVTSESPMEVQSIEVSDRPGSELPEIMVEEPGTSKENDVLSVFYSLLGSVAATLDITQSVRDKPEEPKQITLSPKTAAGKVMPPKEKTAPNADTSSRSPLLGRNKKQAGAVSAKQEKQKRKWFSRKSIETKEVDESKALKDSDKTSGIQQAETGLDTLVSTLTSTPPTELISSLATDPPRQASSDVATKSPEKQKRKWFTSQKQEPTANAKLAKTNETADKSRGIQEEETKVNSFVSSFVTLTDCGYFYQTVAGACQDETQRLRTVASF